MPIAKALGIPALPVTPGIIAGPLGMLPLPSPVDIHIGKPISIKAKNDEAIDDIQISEEVDKIQNLVSNLVQQGLTQRRPFWGRKIVEKIKL